MIDETCVPAEGVELKHANAIVKAFLDLWSRIQIVECNGRYNIHMTFHMISLNVIGPEGLMPNTCQADKAWR